LGTSAPFGLGDERVGGGHRYWSNKRAKIHKMLFLLNLLLFFVDPFAIFTSRN
jgi:hypothetical protein